MAEELVDELPDLDDAPQETGAPPSEGAAAAISGLRDWFKSQGVESTEQFESDEHLARTLYGLATQPKQLDAATARYVHAGRQYQELLADKEFQEWQKSRKRQPTAPAAPKSDLPPWERPEFSPQWEQFLGVDEKTGEWGVLPKFRSVVDPRIPEKYHSYKQWEVDTLRKIAGDFPGLLKQYSAPLLAELKEELRNEFSKVYQHQTNQAAAKQYVAAYAQDIYAINPQTGEQMFDHLGREILNPRGQLLQSYSNEARSLIGKGAADELTENEATRVSQYAIYHTERDIKAATDLQQYIASLQQGQLAGAPPDGQAPNGQAPATSRERNSAQKESWIQKGMRAAKENPGEGYEGGRSTAGATQRVEGGVDDLISERFKQRFGGNL